jgi:polyhydroxyalkanoate synthesis regulator phasin
MADHADGRSPLETLTLAGIGALVLAAGRLDDLADDVARRLGIDREEVRVALVDALESWRREAKRIGEHPSGAVGRVAQDLGVPSKEALDDLELRVAQLEHRLKLLERSQSS